MTLVADIITAAYREANLIAVGSVPTASEIEEARHRLNSLVSSALGTDVGYQLEDWGVTDTSVTRPNGIPIATADVAAFALKPNARAVCDLAAAKTLKLDPMPQDGQRAAVADAGMTFATYALTIDPNGRRIEGGVANLVLNTSGVSREWLYRADRADWVRITDMVTTDEMPLPAEFDDYFIVSLAARISPRHGAALGEAALMRLEQQRAQISVRYAQSRVSSPAEAN